jgi:hypothetical protein
VLDNSTVVAYRGTPSSTPGSTSEWRYGVKFYEAVNLTNKDHILNMTLEQSSFVMIDYFEVVEQSGSGGGGGGGTTTTIVGAAQTTAPEK